MKKAANATRLWSRHDTELWRTDTDYNVPKFHILRAGKEILSTFKASEAIETIKKIRQTICNERDVTLKTT